MMLVKEALALAELGWPVFPVNGKIPVTRHGFKDATVDAAAIEASWRKNPRAGIGLRCGLKGAGLFAVDIDPRHGGNVAALLERGALPPTVESETGGGGTHLLFRQDQSVKSRAGVLPGIDVRGDGGYIVVPPSPHESGVPYRWLDGHAPNDLEVATPPPWLLDLLAGTQAGAPHASPAPHASSVPDGGDGSIPEGSRNETLMSIGGTLRHGGFEEDAIFLVLSEVNKTKCVSPLPEPEVRAIAKSVARYRTNRPMTDAGNAERFAGKNGGDVRFVQSWDKWLVWNEKFWSCDARAAVLRRAKLTARGILGEAAACKDDGRQQQLAKWWKASESSGKLSSMLALAKAEEGIAVSHETFDVRDLLLNVENGTIDLESGKLGPHEREHLLTKCAPVPYDQSAKCPQWRAFLDRVMGGNKKLVAFLQRAVGYSLTGSTSEQVLFFLHGAGANGKSTFCHVLLDLLGPYGTVGAPNMLLAKRGEAHPTEQADLFGARAVVLQEVEAGRAWAEVTLKQLTGGDTVKARHMREDFWSFRPTHKFWVAANHKPAVRGTDYAVWRRLLLVPFTVTIPRKEQDPDLLDKLRAELPGILRWAVDGAVSWKDAGGLFPPPEVTIATEEYRCAEDLVAQFVNECCEKEAGVTAPGGALYDAYVNWCRATGESAMSNRRFGDRLTEQGFPPKHVKAGIARQGLRLTTYGDGADRD